MGKVCIIGGGAAGMMASVFLARGGHETHLYEKNDRLGKKLYITGKGRCNLTNACEKDELFGAVQKNPKFLYSSFSALDNVATMAFFEQAGLPLKVERGNRVFPVSDKASDVIRTLSSQMEKAGVKVHLGKAVKEILHDEEKVQGLLLEDGSQVPCECVLVATGGLSYPTTGSTGDGYGFAREAGHTVTSLSPSLVPFLVRESFVGDLMGLSLRNVTLTVKKGKKVLYEDFGEMLFTQKGITGPLVLSASAKVGEELKKSGELPAFLDLKPALTEQQLDERILRELSQAPNKQFKNVIASLFPASLTPVMVELGPIEGELPCHEVTKGQRRSFGELVKHLPLTLTGLGSFSEAVITRGGVKVGEVDPSTMESKKIRGLFFAGEVLDVDAVTGGFNLQIAWSTGHLAAMGMIQALEA